MRQKETATHGQQRGRRQRGEGLVGNTDRIIICVSIVHEKDSAGSGRRIRRKESGSQAAAGTASGAVAHSFLLTFFGASCLFLGELLKPWGSYLREKQTPISHNMQDK